MTEPIPRWKIIAEAREWLGTPFHHQGYRKGIGADCIGFLCGVALKLDIPGAQEWKATARYHQYGRPPNVRFLLESCEHFLDRVDIEDAAEADILVLSFEREPMHFSLLTRRNPSYVIHSLFGVGRVTEHRLSGEWQQRVRLAYAFRGVEKR